MTFEGQFSAFSFTPLTSLRTAVVDRPARREQSPGASKGKPGLYTHTHVLQRAGCAAKSGLTSLSRIHPRMGESTPVSSRHRDQHIGCLSVRKEGRKDGRKEGKREGGWEGGQSNGP